MPDEKEATTIVVTRKEKKDLKAVKDAENQPSLNAAIRFLLTEHVNYEELKKTLGKRNAIVTPAAEEVVTKNEAELKFIITRYPGQCKKCENHVPAGSPAYWSPDILMCLDCAVDTKSDKALMTRYLKARELDKILRMLKDESNRYADQINELKHGVKFNELVVKFDEMLDLTDKYLKTFPGEKDPLVLRLKKLCDETPAEMEELKAAVSSKWAPIRRKKKVRYTV